MKKNYLKQWLLAACFLLGASSAMAYELDAEGKAPIANAADLVQYAEWWNNNPHSGKIQGIDAYLTADIDMAGIDFPGIGNDGHENCRFHATLDGQGHRITNLVMNGGDCALIPVASDNVVIKNLIIDASCSFTGGRAAAFISASNWPEWGSGKIEFINCGNEANVSGTSANCAAYVGCNYNGGLKIEMTNCYNSGHVKGDRESAAFSGWFGNGDSKVTNCWNIAEVEGVDGSNYLGRGIGKGNYSNCFQLSGQNTDQATSIAGYTSDWMTSGQLCYALNGDQSNINWYQTIGTDAMPVPFDTHGQVYANGSLKCDGTSAGGDLTYSNTSTSVVPPHTDVDGWCSECHAFIENHLEAVDGVFSIGSAKDLNWFASYVDIVNNKANAKLTADIDYTAYTEGYIGRGQGEAKGYGGIFDGQEHTITINITSTMGATGLFNYAHGATIKNLIVDGDVTMVGHNCGGGLGGRVEGTTVENVVVKTVITDNQNGDGTIGGFFAVTAADWKPTTITNSAFYGKILAPGRDSNGGLVGWSDNGSNTMFENVIIAPAEISWNGGGTFTRKGCTVKNCYVVTTGSYGIADTNSEKAILTTAEALASGEIAVKINEGLENVAWFQTIGTDVQPVPFGSHGQVYANGEFYCDGTSKGTVNYSNVNSGSHTDAHNFDAATDVCTACHAAGKEAVEADGVFQINTMGNLLWFAQHVNEGNVTAKAAIKADLEQGDAIYAPIGTTENVFKGALDGEYHSVTLNINRPDADYQGLCGVITDGVHIQNIIVKGSITGRSFVGGIAGGTNGGANNTAWTRLDNCGNEATVTATGVNAGGMIGVNMGGSCSFDINNSYNTGAISGGESGAMSGWSGGGWSVYRNCWNAGMVNGGGGADFSRNNGTNLHNCFNLEGCNNDQTTAVTAAQMASGELTYWLGGTWRQTIGEDNTPVFLPTHGIVNMISAAGWATQYIADTDVLIPAGVKAMVGTINDETLVLSELTDAIAAGEAVVLNGEEGYYSFVPTTGATKAASNDLKGAATETEMQAGMYILSIQDEKVGFYPAQPETTLAAGKAYLETTNDVKGFVFVMEGEEETAVNALNAVARGAGKIYDLNGRQLSKMQKGINIVNGVKVLK